MTNPINDRVDITLSEAAQEAKDLKRILDARRNDLFEAAAKLEQFEATQDPSWLISASTLLTDQFTGHTSLDVFDQATRGFAYKVARLAEALTVRDLAEAQQEEAVEAQQEEAEVRG